jgi:hypothetical protein
MNCKSNTVREVLSPSVSSQLLCFNTQTLTTPNLDGNQIGDEGAQHLAHALQSNAVKEVSSSSAASLLLCFNLDTHHTEPS